MTRETESNCALRWTNLDNARKRESRETEHGENRGGVDFFWGGREKDIQKGEGKVEFKTETHE